MVGVGMLFYSFVACFYLYRPKFVICHSNKLWSVGLEGFEGDEQGLNMLAVLCGIIYPFIGIGCLFTGLGIINKSATRKESFIN